jgi:hypothetical protein
VIGSIQRAWCRGTSFWPETWAPANPAHGQCAVTALVVQDLIGGDIWRGRVEFLPHYWNHVDGQSIDLTLCQFPRGSRRFPDVPVNRDRLLADPSTLIRYQLLKSRLAEGTEAAQVER